METINLVCFMLVIEVIFLYLFFGKKAGWMQDCVLADGKWKTLASKKEFWIIFFCAMIVIRCIGLGRIPAGFNQDGAMGAVDALALAEYGTDRFGTWLPAHFEAWGFSQMSVLLSYMTVPFIKFFGLNSLTVRLPMMLASLAGAAAVYGLVKEMISQGCALTTLFFLTINPWHFMQSRWALDCNVFPHMFIIGTCFLLKGLQKGKYLYVSMVFYALCMYSYGVSFYMVPLFLLAACILILKNRQITVKQAVICVAVYFLLAFPIYGTMLINFMKWDTVRLPFVTMPYFADSVRAGDIIFFSEEPFRQLYINFHALVNVAFLQKPDLIWNAIDDFGTMYKCSIPLVFTGIGITVYQAFKEEEHKKRTACKLLLIYWICSIFTGLCINSVNVNRINIIFYSHVVFVGIAIYYIMKKWKQIAFFFAGIYTFLGILFCNCYFTRWADEMKGVFYSDFLEAVEFAGSLECDYYYITPDTQYTGARNVSEILTMYAHQIDAEYFQGKTDQFMGADIPYVDRYHFQNPSQEELDTFQNTAYVIKTDDLEYYNISGLSVKKFNDYCVMMPDISW